MDATLDTFRKLKERERAMKKQMICKKLMIVITALMLMSTPCSIHVKALETTPKTDEFGTYLIDSSQDMSWFVDYVNAGHMNANAKLLRDITYTNSNSIGSVNKSTSDYQGGWFIKDVIAYTGTFDGNGFKISGIKDKSLFDAIDGATIKNLIIADSNRAIVNYMVSGTLYKCINASSTITSIQGSGSSDRYVGGIVDIVGSSTNNGALETKQSLILSCINYADIHAPWNVGGIAGVARGKNIIIDSCFNLGNFNLLDGRNCGGISSYIDGNVQIKNCFDQASRLKVFNNLGSYGIANIMNQSTITNSYYVAGEGNPGSSRVNKLTQEIIDSINDAEGYQGYEKVIIELKEDGKLELKKQITKELFDYSMQDRKFDTQEHGINVSIKSGISGIGDMSVSYWQVQQDGSSVLMDHIPYQAGTYIVKVSVTEGASYAKVDDLYLGEYSIKKAQPVFVIPSNCTALYNELLSVIHLDADNGTWKWKDSSKVLNSIGKHAFTAIFTPDDIINYDWSNIDGWNEKTKTIEVDINVQIDIDKSSWGQKKTYHGIQNYISSDNVISAEISGNEKTWIKGNNNGIDSWFALDNSSRVFAQGSRFWLRLINKETDSELWENMYASIDESYKKQIDAHKVWLFQLGVTGPDGKEYSILDKNVPLYIQADQNWNLENIQAIFIGYEKDERVTTSLHRNMISPEGHKDFIELTLLHFSPYAIYNKSDIEDDTLQKSKDRVETGDVNDKLTLYAYVLISISSIIVIIAIIKRKKTCSKV